MDASLTADVGEDHPQIDAGEHPDVESSPQDGNVERVWIRDGVPPKSTLCD